MTDAEEPGYGLVMPFVVCASEGGSYDDRAFVAGVRYGDLRKRMESGESPIRSYEPPALVPQIDLSAMDLGYALTSEPWEEHPDEWALVTLVKAPLTP